MNHNRWSEAGVSYPAVSADGTLSFRSVHLAPFAMIRSRCALLPYASWSVRPSAGDRGHCAMVTVELSADNMAIEIEACAGEVR